MTYFQPCKLNCQICKTYCCFDPLLSALSFANSATLELTLANRNLGFQSSQIIKHVRKPLPCRELNLIFTEDEPEKSVLGGAVYACGIPEGGGESLASFPSFINGL